MFTLNTEFHTTDEFLNGIKHGWSSIPVKVTGYWSNDSIAIHVRREGLFAEKCGWFAEVSHSSGGRDSGEVADSHVAERNFGYALIAAADYAAKLETMGDTFEKLYQTEVDRITEKARIEKAAKDKSLAADPAMGSDIAKEMIKIMVRHAKEKGDTATIKMVERTTGDVTYLHYGKYWLAASFKFYTTSSPTPTPYRAIKFTRSEALNILETKSHASAEVFDNEMAVA